MVEGAAYIRDTRDRTKQGLSSVYVATMASSKRVTTKSYIVRAGKEKGRGLYGRINGCMCFACIKWVEDRDDATRFVSRKWPKMIAKRDGGRVVRIVKRGSVDAPQI